MRLGIKNPDKLDLDDFCSYLLRYLQRDLIASIDPMKCMARDDILDKINAKQFDGKKIQIDTKTLLEQGILSLKWQKDSQKNYEIVFDTKQTVYNSDVPIERVMRLIEYGTEGVTPLPFFKPMFEAFAKNLQEWYNIFEKENK